LYQHVLSVCLFLLLSVSSYFAPASDRIRLGRGLRSSNALVGFDIKVWLSTEADNQSIRSPHISFRYLKMVTDCTVHWPLGSNAVFSCMV